MIKTWTPHGDKVGPCPPLLEKNPLFFPYGGPFSSCRDLYANLWLPTFLGLPPHSLRKFLRAPMQWCSGKFLVWKAIMALWSHILSL